jgi:hypothetical protein
LLNLNGDVQKQMHINEIQTIKQKYFDSSSSDLNSTVKDPQFFLDILQTTAMLNIDLGPDKEHIDANIDLEDNIALQNMPFVNKLFSFDYGSWQLQSNSKIRFAWISGKHEIVTANILYGKGDEIFRTKQKARVMGEEMIRIILSDQLHFERAFIEQWSNQEDYLHSLNCSDLGDYVDLSSASGSLYEETNAIVQTLAAFFFVQSDEGCSFSQLNTDYDQINHCYVDHLLLNNSLNLHYQGDEVDYNTAILSYEITHQQSSSTLELVQLYNTGPLCSKNTVALEGVHGKHPTIGAIRLLLQVLREIVLSKCIDIHQTNELTTELETLQYIHLPAFLTDESPVKSPKLFVDLLKSQTLALLSLSIPDILETQRQIQSRTKVRFHLISGRHHMAAVFKMMHSGPYNFFPLQTRIRIQGEEHLKVVGPAAKIFNEAFLDWCGSIDRETNAMNYT